VEAGNGRGNTASSDVGSIYLICSRAHSADMVAFSLTLNQRPWVDLDAGLPD
jgi:hypothetical protein